MIQIRGLTATLLYLSIVTLTGYSCSTTNLQYREGKDHLLNGHNFEKLEGKYSTTTNDVNKRLTLIQHFQSDTTTVPLAAEILPVSPRKIQINFKRNDSSAVTLDLNGKYKKGYFQVKKVSVCGIYFLLWTISVNKKFIGLTKNDELVILDNGSPGTTMVIVFPIWGADAGEKTFIYPKKQ